MTEQAERYDRIAEGYARWWAPVLTPAVERLLDRIAPHVAETRARVLDVGTGTGQLAIRAIERWATVDVDGIDASGEMCAMAASESVRRLPADGRHRFRVELAFADNLPFDDGSFDLAMSSFVLQLVPNRYRALREVHRVLRPGGVFDGVTWLAGGPSFEPDRIFDDLLDELGIETGGPDGPSGDVASPKRAIAELRRAGFHDASAVAETLEHRFSVDGYIGFLAEFDETSLFEDLESDERDWLVASLRDRLAGLSAEAMTMRFPIVFTSARR